MQFKQYKDGSCDIKFSWRERFILFFKGRLHLSAENFKHFGNTLVHIVMQWNQNFNKKISELETNEKSKIDTK